MKNPEFNKTQEVVMVQTGTEQPKDTFRHISKIIEGSPALKAELKENAEQLHDYLLGYTTSFVTSDQILTDFLDAFRSNLTRKWEIEKTSGTDRIAQVDALIAQL